MIRLCRDAGIRTAMITGPIEQARTVTFTVMVAAQLVHAFNCRSDRWPLFHVGVTTNHALIWAVVASLALQVGILTIPLLGPIFNVAPLPIEDWERWWLWPFSRWQSWRRSSG